MNFNNIKKIVEENYDISISSIEKVKSTYKIFTKSEEYCLKVIQYKYPHFKFILSTIDHLKNRGFENIPNIINTKKQSNYIKFDDKFAYLTPWLKCRECNYDNPIDLKNATIKLAELHKFSEGFSIDRTMKPRIGWFSWSKIFTTRGEEILDFKNRISQKAYKSEFDKLYLSIMNDELQKVERTLNYISSSNYFESMKKEVMKRGFCHHDYAHHNVLIGESNKIYIIDFDYCILDTHLHDLSSLCIRTMKEGKWDISKFKQILNNYSKIKSVTQSDIKIMSALIEFPQAYWQLGIQYYWEQQPWEEEFFIRKLIKYSKDREMREEFIKDIRELMWG